MSKGPGVNRGRGGIRPEVMMPDEQEIDPTDYINMVWKRKGLIIGGTLLAAAGALVVSLGIPKTYEVSRTIQIGKLPGGIHAGKIIQGKFIESREAVIGRLRDHRVMKIVMEKVHSGLPNTEMGALVSISTKSNPAVRYKVQTHDPQAVVANRSGGDRGDDSGFRSRG